MTAIIAIVCVAALVAAFLLGRRSSLAEVERLLADLETFKTLAAELHEENCELRKGAL